MSENTNEAIHETPAAEPSKAQPNEQSGGQSGQQTGATSCRQCGSCCKPHTSLIIAVIALLLAGYAVFTASKSHDNTAIETHLGNLDSQVAGINDRMTSLDEAVKSNRENLIQTKLKKALQNVQEIGNLAGENTKAAIHEVENMLKTLTSISSQLATPSETEPAAPAGTEPATESASEPATAPDATPAATAPANNTAQPAPEASPAPTAPTEPAANPADSSAATPSASPPATTPTAPAETPADNQPTPAAPSADITAPSAPQAF